MEREKQRYGYRNVKGGIGGTFQREGGDGGWDARGGAEMEAFEGRRGFLSFFFHG